MLHAVIMAGGSGTRFWPKSRQKHPKQLLRLVSDQTMLQETSLRIDALVEDNRKWIVTNRDQAEETARQLPGLPVGNLLIEPCGRNTAPCIGLAAIHIQKTDPDAVMLVMPADHLIQPTMIFQSSVKAAVELIDKDPQSLVLFGISPTYPSTGFGYIEKGNALAESQTAFQVASFREKPDAETAKQYLLSKKYFWNSGIFVWKVSTILKLIEELEPEIYERLQTLEAALDRGDMPEVLAEEFPQMKSISIDYAILEKAKNVIVMEALFQWDDVGSWQALTRLKTPDENGNIAEGIHVGLETKNCVISSQSEHLIATFGMENCIVVHTPDVTLVAKKDDENAVKQLIEKLKEQGYERYL